MNSEIEKTISSYEAFPILPDAAIELIELANNSAFLFQDMIAIIERDPSIAANVMKEANSAAHGYRGQVSSIKQAAEILNTTELAESVMKSATSSYFSSGAAEGYVYLIRMRDHSVATAKVARALAGEMGQLDADTLFCAGLIHDTGFIAMARQFWEEYSQIIARADNEGAELWRLEKEAFGLSHAEAGAAILERWGLPQAIIGAVKFHHNPWEDSQTQHYSTIIHFANFLSHYLLDRSAPFDLKKKIDTFLHSQGADLVEKYGFNLTPEDFIRLTQKLEDNKAKAAS